MFQARAKIWCLKIAKVVYVNLWISGLYLIDPLSGSMFEVNRSWQDFKAGYWSSSDPFVMMSSQEWFGHMYFSPNSKVVLEIPIETHSFEHILIITEYCLELILPSHNNVPSLLSKYIISILILSIMWNLASLILLLILVFILKF